MRKTSPKRNIDVDSFIIYNSEKIPGLEAKVYENGYVGIDVNGIDFCYVFYNATGIVINDDKNSFVPLSEKSPKIEDRVVLALAECEKYLEENGIGSLRQKSKLVRSIKPQLTDSRLFAGLAQHGNKDALPHINVPLALTDEGIMEVLGMTDFKMLDDIQKGQILNEFNISVNAVCYLSEDPAREYGETELYVTIVQTHARKQLLYDQHIKLPQNDQDYINMRVADYLVKNHIDHRMEKYIAERLSSGYPALQPKTINKLRMGPDGKYLYGEIEFFDDPRILLCNRSNTLRAMGYNNYEKFKNKGISVKYRIIIAKGEDKLYHYRLCASGHSFSTKAMVPLRDDDCENIYNILERDYGSIEEIMETGKVPKKMNNALTKKHKASQIPR